MILEKDFFLVRTTLFFLAKSMVIYNFKISLNIVQNNDVIFSKNMV